MVCEQKQVMMSTAVQEDPLISGSIGSELEVGRQVVSCAWHLIDTQLCSKAMREPLTVSMKNNNDIKTFWK